MKSRRDLQAVTATWDALGRQTAETGAIGTVGYAYDLAGRRLSITWPDGIRANYAYDLSNQVTTIKEGTGTLTTLATYTYDNLGLRTAVARPANTLVTSYGYDTGYRLSSMGQDLNGSVTTNDLGLTFTRNPASQLATRVSSNTAYTYTPALSATAYTNNGRNQVTAAGGATITYSAGIGGLSNGNIAHDGTTAYAYDAANRLLGAGTNVYGYDPLDRLYEEQASVTRRFLYAGDQLIGEYNTSGVIQVRYVPGPGGDEPLAEYAGAAVTTPIFYAQDERGSVIARTTATGLVGAINTYDDYGVPASTVTGRYQYTGQTRLTDTGLYYYKARVYAPSLGRFLQTDPVGYEAGLNLYAYVGNDPVNGTDPTGMQQAQTCNAFGCYSAASPETRAAQAAQDARVAQSEPVVRGQLTQGAAVVLGSATVIAAAPEAGLVALVRGATVSGAAGAAVEAGRQIATSPTHTVENPGAVLNRAVAATGSGAVTSAGGRLVGAPGAAAGAYTGSRATGAGHGEAVASALGAGIAHAIFPRREVDNLGAAIGRQFFRSVVGKTIADSINDATNH